MKNEIDKLRYIFPRGSQSFFDANPEVCPKKLKSAARSALVDKASGKAKSDGRISLSYVLYRVRLLDPDNAYGATKTITDCLCEVGILPGDSADEIEIHVTQEKVAHVKDAKTILNITYPS